MFFLPPPDQEQSKMRTKTEYYSLVIKEMACYDGSFLLEDDLTCPICLEYYDHLEDERKPKFLWCLHTFCVSCIKSLVNDKKIRCSLCRANHDFISIDELLDNPIVTDFLRKKQIEDDEKLARLEEATLDRATNLQTVLPISSSVEASMASTETDADDTETANGSSLSSLHNESSVIIIDSSETENCDAASLNLLFHDSFTEPQDQPIQFVQQRELSSRSSDSSSTVTSSEEADAGDLSCSSSESSSEDDDEEENDDDVSHSDDSYEDCDDY